MVAVEGCRNTLEYPAGGTIFRHEGDDLVSVSCPNMRIVALRNRLVGIDPQLLSVTHDSRTPLYQTGKFDRTTDDLLITATRWKTFLSHFKWTVASKDPGFFVRIVTDMTLLNVFVGNASVKNRLAQQKEEEGDLVVSNSIEDLLSSPDLVIIRLGHLVHPNRAAANILREGVSLRLGLGKATWLVERPEQAFTPLVKGEYGTYSGMPCCDDDVLRLVDSTFERLTLPNQEEAPPAYDEDDDNATLEGPLPVEEEVSDEESPTSQAQASVSASDEAAFEAMTTRRQPGRSPKPKPTRRY